MPAKPRLSGFKPQARNANKHTQRGLGMLDKSMSEHGWIGAVTTAADGETFDGSARLETAYTRFGSEVEPIVVETDGTRPVIVKRTDIASADDPRAKKLAIAANRIAQVDLEWDAEVLAELDEEINLGDFWAEEELNALLERDVSFEPADLDEQGQLDQRVPKEIDCECPECGHQFTKLL